MKILRLILGLTAFQKTRQSCSLCYSLLKPNMHSSDACTQIFTKKWPVKRLATSGERVDAGFYYLGDSDGVTGFYWDRDLKNWEPNENPGINMQNLIAFPRSLQSKMGVSKKFFFNSQWY